MLQYQKCVTGNLSMFYEYSLSMPLRHHIGKSLTRSMQAFGSSPPLPFPLLFLTFIIMSYKFNKINSNNVNVWKIITQHSVLYWFESFVSIVMLLLVNCYAKTHKVSIFFIEQIKSLSMWNLSGIFDLQIHVFPTLLLAPFSHFLIIILQILSLPVSNYLPLSS